MVFVDKTLEAMLEDIRFTHVGFCDTIVPERNGTRHTGYRYFPPPPSPRRQQTEKYYEALLEYAGTHQCIGFALENAFERGNENESYKQVTITAFEGNRGTVVRIRDSGQGFDHRHMLRMLRKGDTSYKQGKGLGLAHIAASYLEAAYEGNGSIINIRIYHQQKDQKATIR